MNFMRTIGLSLSLLLSLAASANAPASHGNETAASPEQALSWLKNGHQRYLNKKLRRHDGKDAADRKRLAKGQHPHTIVLSCSDSRVPPEHVFDQGLGEIFVIRVAGQALDSSVIASIEYAVEHLGTKLVLVMGHESCGAVKAALTTPEGKSAGSEALDKLVADIRPRVKTRTPASENVVKESTANAKGVAADLAARSPIISAKLKSGHFKVVPALYYLGSGQVEFFE